MPMIELSDDGYRRIEEFRAVVCAVMDEEFDIETCLGLVFDRGLDSMLRDILGRHDQSILLESMKQLAAQEPAAVYRYIAEMINSGARIGRARRRRSGIGFSASPMSDAAEQALRLKRVCFRHAPLKPRKSECKQQDAGERLKTLSTHTSYIPVSGDLAESG